MPSVETTSTAPAACGFLGCANRVNAAGLCAGHYRQRRIGQALAPLRRVAKRGDDREAWFWSCVDRSGGPDACWPWKTTASSGDYGSVQLDRVKLGTHRAAWQYANGPIPPGLVVCHRCDFRPCCNPAHLFLGTPAENSADMRAKGRSATGDRSPARLYPERYPRGDDHPFRRNPEVIARGERSGKNKLTDDEVRAIRAACASGLPQREVAARFGVSQGTIGFIVRRETWSHI